MAPPDFSRLSLVADMPVGIKVVRAGSQLKGEREEKGKKKVKLSQKAIDVVMAYPPRRPFPRPSAEKIRAITDPEDPESLELGAELLELFDRSEARMKAWDDEKESIRRQFLSKGEAELEIEVTDDEAE